MLWNVAWPELEKVLERRERDVQTVGQSVTEKEDEKLVVLKRDAIVDLKK
jgi:hypothetical protein